MKGRADLRASGRSDASSDFASFGLAKSELGAQPKNNKKEFNPCVFFMASLERQNYVEPLNPFLEARVLP